jgi:flagellar basal-body rod modification protein FlgD
MVTTSAVGSGGGTTGVDTPSTLTGLSNNYELFLSILTTQIKNQDPLEPMDASQYTDQLVQYSSVEQQIKTNDQLSDVLKVMAASTASSYVSYIGTKIVAYGDTAENSGNGAEWTYNSPDSGKAKVEIRNSLGAKVYAGEIDLSQGRHSYAWDGRTTAGSLAPAGTYSVSIARLDDKGNPAVAVPTETTGEVTGLDFSSGGPVLKIGPISIPASNVISVNRL